MQKYIYVLSNTCQAVKNFQIRLFGIARKSMHFYLPIIPYLCYINKNTKEHETK
jgi:peptidyl-dipeptidase Dcp